MIDSAKDLSGGGPLSPVSLGTGSITLGAKFAVPFIGIGLVEEAARNNGGIVGGNMSFMFRKKKSYKFQVNFRLDELSAVPLVNAMIFARVRLLTGGDFKDTSPRLEVTNHCVNWSAQFKFTCKMSANALTGVLDPCICKVSVRKELKGGRTFQKLGFASINLAEFAGSGVQTRRYLLEGYTEKNRQDNSVLKLTIDMTLLSGDPCFKVPSSQNHSASLALDLATGNGVVGPSGETARTPLAPNICLPTFVSVDGGCGGGGSAPATLTNPKHRTPLIGTINDAGHTAHSIDASVHQTHRPLHQGSDAHLCPHTEPNGVPAGSTTTCQMGVDHHLGFETGHSRNSSYASEQSKASGYSSMHSRQSSGSDSGHIRNVSWGGTACSSRFHSPTHSDYGHTARLNQRQQIILRQTSLDFVPNCVHRSPSSGSGYSENCGPTKVTERKRVQKQILEEGKESRVGATRISANELIDELLQSADFDADDSTETTGLQLFVAKDGTTSLGSQLIKSRGLTTAYEPVVIDN